MKVCFNLFKSLFFVRKEKCFQYFEKLKKFKSLIFFSNFNLKFIGIEIA